MIPEFLQILPFFFPQTNMILMQDLLHFVPLVRDQPFAWFFRFSSSLKDIYAHK